MENPKQLFSATNFNKTRWFQSSQELLVLIFCITLQNMCSPINLNTRMSCWWFAAPTRHWSDGMRKEAFLQWEKDVVGKVFWQRTCSERPFAHLMLLWLQKAITRCSWSKSWKTCSACMLKNQRFSTTEKMWFSARNRICFAWASYLNYSNSEKKETSRSWFRRWLLWKAKENQIIKFWWCRQATKFNSLLCVMDKRSLWKAVLRN